MGLPLSSPAPQTFFLQSLEQVRHENYTRSVPTKQPRQRHMSVSTRWSPVASPPKQFFNFNIYLGRGDDKQSLCSIQNNLKKCQKNNAIQQNVQRFTNIQILLPVICHNPHQNVPTTFLKAWIKSVPKAFELPENDQHQERGGLASGRASGRKRSLFQTAPKPP